jgi:hypothetical protein
MIGIHHYIRYLIQFPYTPHLQGELLTHGHEDKRVDEVVVGEEQPQIDGEGVGHGGGFPRRRLPRVVAALVARGILPPSSMEMVLMGSSSSLEATKRMIYLHNGLVP